MSRRTLQFNLRAFSDILRTCIIIINIDNLRYSNRFGNSYLNTHNLNMTTCSYSDEFIEDKKYKNFAHIL